MTTEATSGQRTLAGSSVRPFVAHGAAASPRWYTGALLTFLATGAETGGQFALFEAVARGGEEIPAHTHTREDEAFYVLDGDMSGEVGGEPFRATRGDFVFLPRDVPHTWRADSDRLHLLVWLAPAGFEQPFLEFSAPAPVHDLPPAGAVSDDLFVRLMQRENELGVFYAFQRDEGTS
jgi:quercetin dioxygenase-like cupin family protein